MYRTELSEGNCNQVRFVKRVYDRGVWLESLNTASWMDRL